VLVRIVAALGAGDSFTYMFDFGDGWEHQCTVLRDDADPVEEYGRAPDEIVPIFGWGTLPDQYGRSEPDGREDSNLRLADPESGDHPGQSRP